MTTTTSPGFTPRPEFKSSLASTPNLFALLTISSSNCIRLYNFPPPVVGALRDLFTTANALTGFRDVLPQNFSEISLEGKPWSNPKSVATERLLVEIFVIIYHHGYSCLSTIDYGRESDDKVAIAFSKPGTTLLSSPNLPLQDSPVPSSSKQSSMPIKRIPFALSFPSATLLRVINPPLHSTPAILQAVRGAWPRGVVSEKKVGSNSFEFRLKGYKWFQEDTFATDSLQHILGLLTALDAHSFTLLASISLTNRSRVKDLWIFTGPASTSGEVSGRGSPAQSILTAAAEFRRNIEPTHQRFATDPVYQHSISSQHLRSASEDVRTSTPEPAPHKVTGQYTGVPLNGQPQEPLLVQAASSPYATPDVFYSTSPLQAESCDKEFSPPSSSSSPSSPPPRVFAVRNGALSSASSSGPATPNELLPSTAFRDSAFSTNTDMSTDIPIKWTGDRPSAVHAQESLGPLFPGGWQPSPIDEKAEASVINVMLEQEKSTDDPVQDVPELMAPPTLNKVDSDMGKSERGIVGVLSQGQSEDEWKPDTPNGKGWVLVNVEGNGSGAAVASDGNAPGADLSFIGEASKKDEAMLPPADPRAPIKTSVEACAASNEQCGIVPDALTINDSPEPLSPSPADATELRKPSSASSGGAVSPNSSMSPAAKAIVIIDAVDAKKKSKEESVESSRRWFSLSRKDFKESSDSDQHPEQRQRKSSRFGLQERLKRLRTPHATRGENRRSIDGS